MKRPWQIWLLFALCVLGAFAGMFWLTQQALRADERRREAESLSRLQQRMSLALWRMDTELAPIIAEEVIRPPEAYRPGPKAVEPPPYVILQFEARSDGVLVSPQGSTSKKGDLSELTELRRIIKFPQLVAQLPSTAVAALNRGVAAADLQMFDSNGEEGPFFEGNTTQQVVQ